MKIGQLTLQVNRRPIKNLHISVMPPDGRVRVSAPEQMTEIAVRMAVISRIPWIKRQQADFARQPRQSDREMVSGECHYYWGRAYRLDVIERVGRHEVKPAGSSKLKLFVNPQTSIENRSLALNEFYRRELKIRVGALIGQWEECLGVHARHWEIRKMKTKWGSCNPQTGRILLNLELVKKPPECLEYILVHELVHLLERRHNEIFKLHLDRLMPDWRERRNLLNSSPLAQERWSY